MRENTQDLSDFGYRERKQARDLLDLMIEEGLPDEFMDAGTTIEFNPHSGIVFLTNDHYQVAIKSGEELKMFRTCRICGAEGTEEDLEWESEHLCANCAE